MMNPDQLAACVRATNDQLLATIRRHEREKHGGGFCPETRHKVLIQVGESLGLVPLTIRVINKELAEAFDAEIG